MDILSNKAAAGKLSGDEKRGIFTMIAAYRKAHGIGCFKHISAATGGKVAVLTISHMYMGTKINDDTWRQVGEALETLQG
jgi:hypothetical protein